MGNGRLSSPCHLHDARDFPRTRKGGGSSQQLTCEHPQCPGVDRHAVPVHQYHLRDERVREGVRVRGGGVRG